MTIPILWHCLLPCKLTLISSVKRQSLSSQIQVALDGGLLFVNAGPLAALLRQVLCSKSTSDGIRVYDHLAFITQTLLDLNCVKATTLESSKLDITIISFCFSPRFTCKYLKSDRMLQSLGIVCKLVVPKIFWFGVFKRPHVSERLLEVKLKA